MQEVQSIQSQEAISLNIPRKNDRKFKSRTDLIKLKEILPKESARFLAAQQALLGVGRISYVDIDEKGVETKYSLSKGEGLKGGGNYELDRRWWSPYRWIYGTLRWTGGKVPYEIDPNHFPKNKPRYNAIMDAINEWRNNTKFNLVERTEKNQDDYPDYIEFSEHGSKCKSVVGRQGGRQYVTCDLDGGGFGSTQAEMAGSIMHEIGHALGFHHEHEREDRRDYVTLTKRRPPYATKKFGYDFRSIMHYPIYNKKGKKIMGVTPKGKKKFSSGFTEKDVGPRNRQKLSYRDKKLADFLASPNSKGT